MTDAGRHRTRARVDDAATGSDAGGQVVRTDEIVELRGLAVETQLDGADRAVPLLGDDDLGGAVDLLAALLPALVAVVVFVVAFVRPARRLAAR